MRPCTVSTAQGSIHLRPCGSAGKMPPRWGEVPKMTWAGAHGWEHLMALTASLSESIWHVVTHSTAARDARFMASTWQAAEPGTPSCPWGAKCNEGYNPAPQQIWEGGSPVSTPATFPAMGFIFIHAVREHSALHFWPSWAWSVCMSFHKWLTQRYWQDPALGQERVNSMRKCYPEGLPG